MGRISGVPRLERLAPARSSSSSTSSPEPVISAMRPNSWSRCSSAVLRANAVAHAVQARDEARVVHRLQQVIDGPRLESADGVLVVRRDEHDHRQTILAADAPARRSPTCRASGCPGRSRPAGATAIAAIASRPFEHCETISKSGVASSRISSPRRDSASSSTMSVRIVRIRHATRVPARAG